MDELIHQYWIGPEEKASAGSAIYRKYLTRDIIRFFRRQKGNERCDILRGTYSADRYFLAFEVSIIPIKLAIFLHLDSTRRNGVYINLIRGKVKSQLAG